MNAAEHDVFGIGFGCFLAEHEGITEEIGMHDNAVSLVMVAEDEQVISQLVLEFLNPVGNGLFFDGQGGVHEVDRAHWEVTAMGLI